MREINRENMTYKCCGKTIKPEKTKTSLVEYKCPNCRAIKIRAADYKNTAMQFPGRYAGQKVSRWY
jgi:predicted RNA-binding Zn-ribbon protein involved in translation (DUF1610 family)